MVEPKDRVAQGDPETVVLLPEGSLLGLYVKGTKHGPIMLGIREDRDGHPVSCAITQELRVDYPLHSNPRRPKHGYGHAEE